ncbi:6-bladed beta-propeller protein [Sphingobacterium allocomposti]|uniref:6-bladed beta-propeller protein n=1 Tax=Sphingobacterium allocomposti TaxID=415956 RepID=A0A5S5DL00_9SPHI|nr:6-bladed beta-propeller [Sphingobacterium composti Yoo et al. 2007 non Ten et al. 2007]TYP96375.1 6-bladed beta-propeller protein [Sphingobacterium composti Yoo et al. 2007 non Ten et al. 2007]
MIRNRRFLLILLYSFFFIILRSQTANETIRIDPDNALGATVSDFFDHVDIIPLETTKESVFGRVYQLKVIDNRLIIGDNETLALLIFSSDGKFIKKLKLQKDFTIDRKNKEIAVLDGDNKISYYDLNGKLLRSKKLEGEFTALFSFNNGGFALSSPRPSQPARLQGIKHDVFLVDNSLKRVGSLFPYDATFGIMDYNQYYDMFNDQGNGTTIYSLPYRYTAFEIDETGISRTYKFIFPEKYSLPKDFDNDSIFFNKRKDYIFNPKSDQDYYRFRGLNPFYRHQNLLFFNTNSVYLTYNNDLVYDLSSRNIFSLNRIVGDSTSFYLPILHAQSQQSLRAIDENSIYTTMPAGALLQLKKEIDLSGKSPTRLFKITEMVKSTDNPIIIRSRFKTNDK